MHRGNAGGRARAGGKTLHWSNSLSSTTASYQSNGFPGLRESSPRSTYRLEFDNSTTRCVRGWCESRHRDTAPAAHTAQRSVPRSSCILTAPSSYAPWAGHCHSEVHLRMPTSKPRLFRLGRCRSGRSSSGRHLLCGCQSSHTGAVIAPWGRSSQLVSVRRPVEVATTGRSISYISHAGHVGMRCEASRSFDGCRSIRFLCVWKRLVGCCCFQTPDPAQQKRILIAGGLCIVARSTRATPCSSVVRRYCRSAAGNGKN